jgi:hypothetical protein
MTKSQMRIKSAICNVKEKDGWGDLKVDGEMQLTSRGLIKDTFSAWHFTVWNGWW